MTILLANVAICWSKILHFDYKIFFSGSFINIA